MELFNVFHLIYWTGLGVIILIEAATFGVLWERREEARWTMGYFTVFFLGIPLVILGVWDAWTWVGLFFGVGLSGAVKVGFDIWRKARAARELRQKGGDNGGSSPWVG